MIHVRRGVPPPPTPLPRSPFCAENANNVRCLCWRESVALTVSHPSPLGRKEGRKEGGAGREGGKEHTGECRVSRRKREGRARGGGGSHAHPGRAGVLARACLRARVVHMRASECVVELGHSRHVSPRLQRRQAKLT